MPPPPALPSDPSVSTEPKHEQSELQQDITDTLVLVKPKSTTRRKPTRPQTNSKDQQDDSEHYSDDKFAEWMPPENEQTGDGRTVLNDKYGY